MISAKTAKKRAAKNNQTLSTIKGVEEYIINSIKIGLHNANFFVKGKNVDKVVSLLEKKGYEVWAEEAADGDAFIEVEWL